MHRYLVFLIFLLLPAMLAAEDIRKEGADMATGDQTTAKSLLGDADEIFQSRDYAKAQEAYQLALEASRAEFNRPVETEALSQLARMHLIQGNKEDGRIVLAQAAERATDGDPMGWSRYLGVLGRFQWQDDDLKTALKTFNDMYVFCNTKALWSRAIDAAHMIAIVSPTPEEQIEWGRRGIEAAEAAEVESWLGPLWNNLAGTYYDAKQYESALECYVKAREYHWRHSGEVGKLYADYHVGMTYRQLEKYDEASQWLRPVLAWAERLENHSAIGQACEDLGEIDIALGRPVEGLALLRRAKDEYQAAGFDTSWPEIWININERIAAAEKN